MELKILNKQNNSRMCLVCGFKNDLSLKAEFYELEDKSLCALVKFKDVHQGYPARVHGGILAAILDETIGRAMMPYTGEEKWGVTISLTTARSDKRRNKNNWKNHLRQRTSLRRRRLYTFK